MINETNDIITNKSRARVACRLLVWWIVCFVVWSILAAPTLTPPGNVWTIWHTLTCLLIVFGAFYSARPGLSRMFYLLYGCSSGCYVMFVLLPDNRDYISIAMGKDSIEPYLFRTCALVLSLGILSRAAAQFRLAILARRLKGEDNAKCTQCGYLLYGLPEPRCPECGTPFDLKKIPRKIVE